MKEKITVCITVLNEEKSIGRLLQALLDQTRKPDEIVIVDGGSVDKTIDIIRHFQKKDSVVKLLVEECSVSKGRNLAISLAKGEIVVMTDAGCVPYSDWLEKLVYFFRHKEVDIVAGFYDMPTSNGFSKAVSCFLGIPEERFDPVSFLPSTRSVAFRKSVWEKVGGFDERLGNTGEDTLFFARAVKSGFKIVRVKEARVVWEEVKKLTLKDFFNKISNYAKGDISGGIWIHPTKGILSHNIKNLTIFPRYFVFAFTFYLLFIGKIFYLFPVLVFLYLSWSILKWKDVVLGKDRIYLPLIQIVSDIAVMTGFSRGVWEKSVKIIKRLGVKI